MEFLLYAFFTNYQPTWETPKGYVLHREHVYELLCSHMTEPYKYACTYSEIA